MMSRTVPPPGVAAPWVTESAAGKELGEAAVDVAGVGSALILLVFEPIKFGEDIGRDAEVVVGETVEGRRVVEENVRVQDVVFPNGGGRLEAKLGEAFLGEAAGRGGFFRGAEETGLDLLLYFQHGLVTGVG